MFTGAGFSIPQVTHFDEADISDLESFMEKNFQLSTIPESAFFLL